MDSAILTSNSFKNSNYLRQKKKIKLPPVLIPTPVQ